LNTAFDEVLTARSRAGGIDRRLTRLVALLSQAHLVAEAAAALALSGERPPPAMIGAVDALADAIGQRDPPPEVPAPPEPASAGLLTLHEGIAGAVDLLTGRRPPPVPPAARATGRLERARSRLSHVVDQVRGGRLTRMFIVRLMASVGVAAVFSEVLPLQRSYWVVLTVAIVLKPDFGSVFVRAVQRGAGTVAGAVIGAVLLAAVPPGPLLLIPLTLCAALLPYGRSRNYGLFSAFLTPAVVLLIDVLAPQGWQLAEARLIDTLVGCGIVLLVGYAPWPGHWRADMPRNFAAAADRVAAYTRRALIPNPPAPAGPPPPRARLRRQAYRALSDFRLEFQRTMAEPGAARRVAAAWFPAAVALEQVMDAVTAVAVAADRGAPLPAALEVENLVAALCQVADAVRSGRPLPGWPGVTVQGQLGHVADAVRGVHQALAPPQAA
jgi:uncharacterized membrane protein YccC